MPVFRVWLVQFYAVGELVFAEHITSLSASDAIARAAAEARERGLNLAAVERVAAQVLAGPPP